MIMIGEKLPNSRGKDRLSPSPKPLPQDHNSLSNSRSRQHRRAYTLGSGETQSIDIGSEVNSSLSLINSKIQNILENYKMYESHCSHQTLKNSPYVECTKISNAAVSPKKAKMKRVVDKENQNINQVRKRQRRFKSVVGVLEDITVENKPRTNALMNVKDLDCHRPKQADSISKVQYEDLKVQKSSKIQNSITNKEDSIQMPKILSKLRKNSHKKSISSVSILEEELQTTNSQKNRFIELLSNQIQLDQKFRKAKQWFKRYKKDHKWWLLERELKKCRLWVNELAMKTIFMITTSQQNPFDSEKDEQNSIKHLVTTFKEAQEHWLIKIKHNFNFKALKNEGFFIQNLDPAERGHIQIQDLIRFINCHMGSFHSCRQLQLIFLRLRQKEHLQYYDLVQSISKSVI